MNNESCIACAVAQAAFYLIMTGLMFGYILNVEFPPPHDKGDIGPQVAAAVGGIFWPVAIPMLIGERVFTPSERYEATGESDASGQLYRKVK